MEAHTRTGVSRRTFLTALGAAAGAGAVYAAIQTVGIGTDDQLVAVEPSRAPASGFALQDSTEPGRVVVLGSGIAGLCCAYELGKAGYDVTVLEAGERLGGRNWTVRSGTAHTDAGGESQMCTFGPARWLNAGPARIAQHHSTLDYCRELGVPVEVFVNANIDAFVENDGTVRRRRSALADLNGYVSELLAKCLTADALDDELTISERDRLTQHLRTIGALGRADRGYDSPHGTEGGSVGPSDPLDVLLGLGVGPRLAFERDWHQAMPMFHPVGGMDRIVEALADAIGRERILLGHRAEGLTQTADGVRVDVGGSEPIEADWGICCIQPGLAAALPNPWPANVNMALREPRPIATGKIGLEYGNRFWETGDRILGGITSTHPDVRVIWYPSTDYLSDGGVIMGAYPFGPPGERFGNLSHGERESLAVARGEAIHGESYRTDLVSSFSVAWNSVADIQGAWTAWSSYGASYSLLQEPAGRWLFAGDWLSHTPGWQHGAFESARLAVATVHELALNE